MAVFRRLTLGMPSAEIQVIEPISIVKDIVLKRVSWPIFKAKGVTKSDWQNFKKYLEMIPEEGIVEEISAACRSSEAQAVQLLDEFCTSANSYFDGDTIEETMIAKAIMDSPELLQRSKEMVSAEWHKENDTAIKEANAALAAVQAETAATERRNAESISELEKINAKIAEVSSTLDEKLGFAENVDTIVAERIQKAKENAAEFIASMAFAAPPSPVASEVTPVQISTVSTIMPAAEYCTGAMLDLTNMEEYKDARTAIESIGFELAEAGVADKFTHILNRLTPAMSFKWFVFDVQVLNRAIRVNDGHSQLQVCLRLPDTSDREIENLLEIKDHYPKYVVTMDDLAAGNVNGVKLCHLADFLLCDNY